MKSWILEIVKSWTLQIILLAAVLGIAGCSSSAVQEAKRVVAQADSLRTEGKMYGMDEGDSTTIANAYETLKKRASFCFLPLNDGEGKCLSSYAHACYHYGRLLREKGDPVSAMQVFIEATHSHTRDHHILGRTYSNMGSISHLAGEYQLAYDMYNRSAEMFLQSGDSLLYYCLLSDMAFELAKQEKPNEVYALLGEMPVRNYDHVLHTKNIEALLVLNKSLRQYDSVLLYADSIVGLTGENPLLLISKAQSFCHLQQFDSATYYAHKTISSSTDLFNLNNALYILIHCDSINNGYKVYNLSAERADVQKQLEIRQGKLSQAIQLLEQDLKCKPDLRWLYVVAGILLCLIAICVLYYEWRRRKQHRKIIVDIQKKEVLHNELEKSISNLSELQDSKYEQIIKNVEDACSLLSKSSDIKSDLSWKDYEKMCSIVNQQFFQFATKLRVKGVLTEKEIRLCILTLFDLNRREISDILPYAYNSVGKLKYQTAKKLGTTGKNLRTYLLNLVIKG